MSRSEHVELLARLVRTRSDNPPGAEDAVAAIVAERLRQAGLDVAVEPFAAERSNVFARLRGGGERPALLLNGHLDTVPVTDGVWTHPPFAAVVDNGRMYGRGTSDMKAGLVSLVLAVEAVARRGDSLAGDLLFLATGDEEVACLGATAAVDHWPWGTVGGIVVAEPTDLGVWTAEKGALWLRATVRGKAAHGAYPHLGVNAIGVAAAFVDRLRGAEVAQTRHPLLGGMTMNVGTIAGGTKPNIVADRCAVTIDIRTVPGQDHAAIRASLAALLGQLCADAGAECDLEVLNDRVPVETPPNDPLVVAMTAAVQDVTGEPARPGAASYYTDGAVLGPALGAPLVICGPGESSVIHQADEWVRLDRVAQAAHVYEGLIDRVLR